MNGCGIAGCTSGMFGPGVSVPRRRDHSLPALWNIELFKIVSRYSGSRAARALLSYRSPVQWCTERQFSHDAGGVPLEVRLCRSKSPRKCYAGHPFAERNQALKST